MKTEHETTARPKLPLTAEERGALRAARLRLADFVRRSPGELEDALGGAIGKRRLAELRGLALFQQLPSIGPAMAADLVRLGFTEPDQLVGQEPDALFGRLERLAGPQDPCVADCLHCAVYYAEHPRAPHDKPWWHWSQKRLKSSKGRNRRR